MRTIPARERGVDRIGKLTETVGAGSSKNPTRPWPVMLTPTADQLHLNR
jgi:hypothetical protein